ncbi:MAG TPA: pentapeptide repeat-containing protein [Syntrophales bacterium]|nr:pentapeptide repeat-containing protein [Syntrophales bacterium]
MKFEIKHRFTGSVIFSLETESLKLCVEAAVKSRANLYSADLCGANLRSANLYSANLRCADLHSANLYSADLCSANPKDTKNLVKLMGVEPGNSYWKRFDAGLNNNGYQFKVGLNELRKGEKFADDERKICSSPGFHFASRSWCAAYYPDRPLEARIYLPTDAKINEPWATDGKASADKIFILQVFDVKTGEDVTEKYR